jgi:anti-sigma regulatory factor (Ser/Thr protein kinase)
MPDQHIELPAQTTSPRIARDYVVGVLHGWGLDGLAESARLLTSELVTNAVLHARTSITVHVSRDEARHLVRVSVLDGSARAPRERHYSELSTTGRGLHMVRGGSRDFGIVRHTSGKSVWFELPYGDEPPVARAGGATA